MQTAKAVSEKMEQQRTGQILASYRATRSLEDRLTRFQLMNAELQAERAIANTKSSIALSKLSSKFNLIKSLQQNLG